ncbi:PAS domain S-box protein [Pseudomonas capeferrum]|uniref:PAS domain-containing hybrid sensor histidine kinase/response regulator n=1 Tax=Pseudomonas capeferrum TaxID=1495066 RepID=UPI0015E4958C|nr:PAS domain S-box protein [Pseudomonas capeferrum]MBA1201871.1 PAS domain S-box protein [Pseudomonas capeferrum]
MRGSFEPEKLKNLSREELESEVLRLRRLIEDPAIAVQNASINEPGAQEQMRGQGSQAVSSDVSTRTQAGRCSVAGSDARQQAIFDSAVDFAMIVIDPQGSITDWNAGAMHVMGWTSDEMQGQPAERFFTSEDRAQDRLEYEMISALQRGRATDERWHLRKDGRRFWASGEMMPLYGDNQVHLGFVKILRDRTSEHLAGRAIEEAQTRYRLALKATNDAIWDWDLTAHHVLWNDALEQAYGHAPATVESTGEWWLAHIHPDDRDRIHASIHAVIDGTGSTWADEYRFRRVDGSYAQVLDRGQVIRDEGGRAVRMIGAMLDLTRIRSTEAALRQSEERFRTIVATIESAFAIVEVKFDAADQPVDYRFLEANPAFEKQSGVDLQGKWVTEFAPDLEPFWFETYGRVAKTGIPATFENYAERFARWFDVRAVRVGDPADRQIAILFSDVTERRNAEARLRASEALARENVERVQLALAAGAIFGTWHLDLRTGSFTVDEAFARAFGLDPAMGHKGLSLDQVIATVHPEDRDGLLWAIDEVVSRGGAYAHQYRVRRADGKYYWIEANGRVDHAEDGTPLSFPGVLIDVQERRSVEAQRDRAIAALRSLTDTLEQRVAERTAELMQTEEKLRQSQKMEAVGQLTGGLAHDFNNLLAGISGALELMSKKMAQGRMADVDRYLATAQGAAKRAAALTHRLLAFSRRQTLDPRPADINSLVEGMIELIQRTVGPGIVVETVKTPDSWPVRVDTSQLENALLNLCINARDAMLGGGRITIETSNRQLDEQSARALDVPEGGYLVVSVTDTGVGMSPDVLAKAFDPFFTTKPIGQGTGLGLSMIYGFAKQSGGQVSLASTEGEGTTICIYLPCYHGTEPTLEEVDSPAAAAPAIMGQTILVVDDEPTVRMLLTDSLNELGYTVIEAADSGAGLKVLRSDVRIDMLISDVGLPGGMNGRQMADAAREVRPGLKTLFITGYAESAAIGDGHLEPGMHVMTKPFEMDTFASRVGELIRT